MARAEEAGRCCTSDWKWGLNETHTHKRKAQFHNCSVPPSGSASNGAPEGGDIAGKSLSGGGAGRNTPRPPAPARTGVRRSAGDPGRGASPWRAGPSRRSTRSAPRCRKNSRQWPGCFVATPSDRGIQPPAALRQARPGSREARIRRIRPCHRKTRGFLEDTIYGVPFKGCFPASRLGHGLKALEQLGEVSLHRVERSAVGIRNRYGRPSPV